MGKLITLLTLISRFPIPVNLTRPDLKKELDRGRRTVVLPLSHRGTCAMVEIGHTLMSEDSLVENVVQAAAVLAKRYPGGWKNLRSLHVKTEKSMAVPLHVSTSKSR